MKTRLFVFRLFVLLTLLLLAVMPSLAQEPTPEASPPPEPTASPIVITVTQAPAADVTYGGLSRSEIILIGVLLVVVVGGGFLLNGVLSQNKDLAVKLAGTLPEWAWNALQDATNRGFAELGDVVESTPNTFDDDLFRRFEEEKNRFFEEIRRELPAQVAQAMADKSPPRSGDWQS